MKHTRFIPRKAAAYLTNLRNSSIRPNQKRGRTERIPSVFAAITSALMIQFAATAAELESTNTVDGDDISHWTLERLMSTPVTILKSSETLSESPAAITVVSQDDIRRSGALSIPEVLRLVPGLQVARVDSSEWAVSARGFNDIFANKLLVLQDGRSIYSPLFSGVFWDVQGTMMEDIDRIEVIRGPGATLWGANAVNGVINIITKSARQTQGGLISGGGGTLNRGFGSVRYGGRIGENAYYRVYGTYINRDDSLLSDGSDAFDGLEMTRGGFRLDWYATDSDLLTLQGDIYCGTAKQEFATYDPLNPPFYLTIVPDHMSVHGGNVLGRWTRTLSEHSDLKVQMYYDRTERDAAIINESRNTFDLDAQYGFALGERHSFVFGAGYRVTQDRIINTPTISFTPNERTIDWFSAFLQDEVTIVPDRFELTLGSKFERNDFTGWEFQPGGRLLWTPHENHTVWASVSRAVRTPSRTEDDVKSTQIVLFPGPTPAAISIYGNQNLRSEELMAYELGYRAQPHEKVAVDVTAFYNVYENLRTIEFGPSPTQPPTAPPPPPGLVIPQHFDDNLEGETFGVELAISLDVCRGWRLRPSYTFLNMDLRTQAGSTDTMSAANDGRNPRHQFSLLSSMDFPHDISLDCNVRYVDALPTLGIDSYVTMDLRLGWRPTKNLELSIVGQDLLSNRHAEYGASFVSVQQTQVPRSVFGKITWRF